ncbi:MAG: hypothetical protein KME28_04745 [Pelatocladus maniniholoensis HA4357-MV3]|jgi:hypothetical protein|uniref:DUF6876 domain-containing protein n=1 Tax=Pelatocladus maniniholoensis HA4357-MV3 TaxID=1117104 RepID=A0A9E3H5B4_9NOST|nr:hypothetical protein [Pelatocladus maniniholoensis HA4357-MV3]
MENPEQITAALKQFIGSGIIYQHWLGIGFTEGVKYLADAAEAYWLIDSIASHQTKRFLSNTKLQNFQIWLLSVKEKSGTLICEWDTGKEVLRQEIEYTDFPINSIKVYLISKVLMLPTEY